MDAASETYFEKMTHFTTRPGVPEKLPHVIEDDIGQRLTSLVAI